MDQKAAEFAEIKNLAIAGVSRNGRKFGNTILKELVSRGYTIYPVHHSADMIEGTECYKKLSDLSGIAGGLIISVKPGKVPALLHEAADAGIKNIWLQQGASSDAAKKTAYELGLNLTDGKCILMYTGEVKGIHRFHRTIAGWFGKV